MSQMPGGSAVASSAWLDALAYSSCRSKARRVVSTTRSIRTNCSILAARRITTALIVIMHQIIPSRPYHKASEFSAFVTCRTAAKPNQIDISKLQAGEDSAQPSERTR